MGVNAIMGNLPELGLTELDDLGERIDVSQRDSVVWAVILVNGSSTPRVAFIRP